MPPYRTASNTVKQPAKAPAKTERTHEENQERAYIAASRRSDRSIEARVESARRASEIHKKRTGRSLRVTEKDVENEEMYEEEDDDLPMRYRRYSALNPGQPFTAFEGRLNNYMSGQIGMRNYLHQAIYQANQNAAQHREMNAMIMQQQQQNNNAGLGSSPSQATAQSTWSPHQMAQQDQTIQTESFTHSPSQQQNEQFAMRDAGSMSLSLPSPGHRRNASNASASLLLSGRPQAQHQPPPSRPQTGESSSSFDDSDPLTPTLPINQQQLLDGNPSFANGVHASQMTAGVSMPSTYQYHYNPNAKANNTPGSEQFAFGHKDLNQTLAPQNMHTMQFAQTNAAPSMPSEMDFNNDDLFASSLVDDNSIFDFDQFNSGLGRSGHNGQMTPGDSAWNPDEWLDFNNASGT